MTTRPAESPIGDGPEVLAWAVRANLSREVVTRQKGRKRPGTKHFAPGAALWVGPSYSGDGYEMVEMVGMKRGTRGRRPIRCFMPSVRLTNFRAAAIYSSSIANEIDLGRWWGDSRPQEERSTSEVIADFARFRNAYVTQASHFYDLDRLPHWWLPKGQLHYVEEDCAFCLGIAAAIRGSELATNPFTPAPSPGAMLSNPPLLCQHDAWNIGWMAARRYNWRTEPDRDSIDSELVARAEGLMQRRRRATNCLIGGSHEKSPLAGLPIDQAELVAANMQIRTRIIFCDDDGAELLGRITLRLDDNDCVESVRGG